MTVNWKQSLISRKYPTYRDVPNKSTERWLAGKRMDDNAEGLWRIYDSLYDLTNFVNHHPGGPDWIGLTKGTDITELFEAHHISETPSNIIEKYKVRQAKEPRNITLTLKENGFYKTLKGRVREKLKTIDQKKFYKKSDAIHTILLIVSFLLCITSVKTESTVLGLFTGLWLNWTVISAHNYFHRKDNWRMYTFNLSLMSYREWRVSHAMSHHMYANSYHDLELSLFEPFLCWVPNPYIKNLVQRYGSWIYSPVIYIMIPIIQYLTRVLSVIITGKNPPTWEDLIPFTIPLTMYLSTSATLGVVLQTWLLIMTSMGFFFGLIGLTASHHHPDILHDGDAMRDNRDWGLYQIDTIIDRKDLKGSQFLVLTHFGDHALHHLFPTLDHGVLPHLYPILYETLSEFGCDCREQSWIRHIVGQFQQLARVIPNPVAPGAQKKKGQKQKFISTH